MAPRGAAEGEVGSIRSVGVVLAAALFAAPAPGGEDAGAKAAAEGFYRAYLQARGGGIPSRERLAGIRPLVSAGLYALLEAARDAEDAYAAKTHGESPPLLEGDLFTSLFEGATRVRVGECRAKAAEARCRAALTYLDSRGGKPVEWTDTVALVKEGGGWRVSDIEFGGTWEFMHAGRLVGVLEGVIDEAKGP